jgi:large subunit ribosomal protein L33
VDGEGPFGPPDKSQRRGVDLSGKRKMAGKGKKKKAEIVFLVCEETGDYNYTLRRKPGGEKLKLKKYCPRLRKHTVHTEKKK